MIYDECLDPNTRLAHIIMFSMNINANRITTPYRGEGNNAVATLPGTYLYLRETILQVNGFQLNIVK